MRRKEFDNVSSKWLVQGIMLFILVIFVSGCHWQQSEQETVVKDVSGLESAAKAPSQGGPLAVQLYFYNFLEDKEIDESVPCNSDAVLAVDRQIPRSETYLQDTLELLLQGDITEEEGSFGFMTEFPNQNLSISNLNLSDDGELSLKFNDPDGFLSGGSCRIGLLYSQIEKTALQFIEINKVTIIPEELFEP